MSIDIIKNGLIFKKKKKKTNIDNIRGNYDRLKLHRWSSASHKYIVWNKHPDAFVSMRTKKEQIPCVVNKIELPLL